MAKPSTSSPYEISVPKALDLDRMDFLELYYFMMLNRKLEERLGILYRHNQVVGGLYSSQGQEAISVGSAYAMVDGDCVGPMIRNLGTMLVRGVKPVEVIAQYCARAIGPTRGKDLNLHFGWVDRGLIAPISMLGALIPVMAGIAMQMVMKKKQQIAMTYIGDGGMSTTDFHEGINFAAVHKLPLILFVENNGWAYSTPTRMQANIKDLAIRAKSYGIYGEIVDGNNVLAVLDATRRARLHCLAGKGPVLIEAKTFRRKGHAEHDDAGYVPAAERKEWEKKDPIDAYRAFLLRSKVIEAEVHLEEIDQKIVRVLEKSVTEALDSPFPDPSIAQEDVYA